MGDFYSILTKAIGALDPNTKEARRRLYERARAALVAETRRLNQAESDFLAVLGSLEEAIQEIEAEAQARAQRERRIEPQARAAPAAPPRRDTARASPPPATPTAPQRFGRFMPFFARAFRRGRDGARNLLQRPARSDSLASDLASEMDTDPARDNWLSELLARASRPEHDSGGRKTLPRRDVRRDR